MATPNTRVMLTDSLGNAHYLSLSINGAFLNIVDTATGNTVQLDMRNGTIADNTDLALKAPIASPSFTGTVAGITKAMVGLDLVDNTADLSKPVSTATQTALNLKAPLYSPAFTGTPTAPTAAVGTNTTQVATTTNVYASVNNFGGGISAAVTLSVTQSGAKFYVGAATAAYNITLPAPAAGLNFEFFGVNGTYVVGLTYGGNLYLPDSTVASGTFSQINLADSGNTIKVWSDGGAWFMSTLGQEIVKNGVATNQAVNLGQLNLKVNLAGTAGGQTINGGTAAGESLTLTGTSSATKSATGIKLGSVVTVDEVNGRVGVGTTAPQGNIDIFSAVNAGTTPLLSIRSDFAVAVGNYGMIRFGDQSQTTAYQKGAIIYEGVAGSARGRFHIALNNDDLSTSVALTDARLTVLSNGNVGIGTVTPAVKLDVVGLIKTSGYTVATLPAGVTGARAYVTDAVAPTYNGALTGGGTVTVPVFFNGTAWVAA